MQFPIWKTLRIGGKSKDQLIAEIEAADMKIYDYARSMMGMETFTTSSEFVELSLVRVTALELGFEKGAATMHIWHRAQDLGLAYCPAEVGPHLRLLDADQAIGDGYWIGMEPIIDPCRCPSVFRVVHDVRARWLGSVDALPVALWHPEASLVFVSPAT